MFYLCLCQFARFCFFIEMHCVSVDVVAHSYFLFTWVNCVLLFKCDICSIDMQRRYYTWPVVFIYVSLTVGVLLAYLVWRHKIAFNKMPKDQRVETFLSFTTCSLHFLCWKCICEFSGSDSVFDFFFVVIILFAWIGQVSSVTHIGKTVWLIINGLQNF